MSISQVMLFASGVTSVATPSISPNGGTYSANSTVSTTISTTTPGATIRYTTDGSTPSSSNGTIYSGAFNMTWSGPIKAIAYYGAINSSVTTSTFTIPIKQTWSFNTTALSSYTVPYATTLSLKMWGHGGANGGASGGAGGALTRTSLSLNAGDILYGAQGNGITMFKIVRSGSLLHGYVAGNGGSGGDLAGTNYSAGAGGFVAEDGGDAAFGGQHATSIGAGGASANGDGGANGSGGA
jgi:hypothetical protein